MRQQNLVKNLVSILLLLALMIAANAKLIPAQAAPLLAAYSYSYVDQNPAGPFTVNNTMTFEVRLKNTGTEEAPTAGRIAFVSHRDGNAEIYSMRPDGSGLTRLTNHPAEDVQPNWSPDGRQIVFASNRSGSWDIYTMNADGSEVRNLTKGSPFSEKNPAWSPDGTRIAFEMWQCSGTGDVAGESQICVLEFTSQTQTCFAEGQPRMPSWSPDGRRIAFINGMDFGAGVYVINADGSDLTGPLYANWAQSPDWSPDGSRIVFDSVDGIIVINVDGSNPVSLGTGFHPVWSPDGQQIAFCPSAGPDNSSAPDNKLALMSSDGTNVTVIAEQVADWCDGLDWYGPVLLNISGRVTDAAGAPIPDVTVRVPDGHQANTDAQGYYALTGLTAGAYTLMPQKSGYTFAPPTRDVTVPPSATGQDFLGTLSSLNAKVSTPTPSVTPTEVSSPESSFQPQHRWLSGCILALICLPAIGSVMIASLLVLVKFITWRESNPR